MTDKKRNTASLIIYTLLLAAMLGLIVFLTFQSSEDTMRLSGGVQKLLIAIFGGEKAPEWLSDSHLIRSAAHLPLYFLLGTVIFTLLLIWAVQLNAGMTARKEIAVTQARIETLKAENDSLRDQVQETRSETSIGYEAVQMGLISSKGVSAVYLAVPGDANMLLADSSTFVK